LNSHQHTNLTGSHPCTSECRYQAPICCIHKNDLSISLSPHYRIIFIPKNCICLSKSHNFHTTFCCGFWERSNFLLSRENNFFFLGAQTKWLSFSLFPLQRRLQTNAVLGTNSRFPRRRSATVFSWSAWWWWAFKSPPPFCKCVESQ
jgi:hypothetical protein